MNDDELGYGTWSRVEHTRRSRVAPPSYQCGLSRCRDRSNMIAEDFDSQMQPGLRFVRGIAPAPHTSSSCRNSRHVETDGFSLIRGVGYDSDRPAARPSRDEGERTGRRGCRWCFRRQGECPVSRLLELVWSHIDCGSPSSHLEARNGSVAEISDPGRSRLELERNTPVVYVANSIRAHNPIYGIHEIYSDQRCITTPH